MLKMIKENTGTHTLTFHTTENKRHTKNITNLKLFTFTAPTLGTIVSWAVLNIRIFSFSGHCICMFIEFVRIATKLKSKNKK